MPWPRENRPSTLSTEIAVATSIRCHAFWANQRDKVAYATTPRLCAVAAAAGLHVCDKSRQVQEDKNSLRQHRIAVAAAAGLHVCDKSRQVQEDNNSLRQHRIDTSCRHHRSPRSSGRDVATARVGAKVGAHFTSAQVIGWIQRVY